MTKTKTILAALILVTPLLVAGCSQPPTDAVNAAKAALEAAQAAGATDYAAEEMGAAEGAMVALEAELAIQNEKFSPLRSYAKAAELAAAAQAAAVTATEEAASGKEATRTEATTLMEGVRTSLLEVQDLLAKAPRGKGTRAELDAMKADLVAVEVGFEGFDALLAEGRYLEALSQAQAAQGSIDTVKTEIQAAIDAKGRARGN